MTNNTQPEALRLAEMLTADEWPGHVTLVSYAQECVAELRRQHTRIAELEAQIEALSGVQALSAAPAVPAGWKLVPVNPTPEMWKAAKSVPDPNPPYPPHYGLVWDAMLAATPTPPAEQQAAQVIIDFSQVGTAGPFPVANGRVSLPDATMQDLARMLRPTYEAAQQAAPKAAPAGATLPDGWVPLMLRHEGQYPEEVAYGPQIMMDRLAKWLGKYFAQVVADAAPQGSTPAGGAGAGGLAQPMEGRPGDYRLRRIR